MKYKLKLLFFFLLLPAIAVAQEELKSDVEDYYDFLSLSGTVERPYLNFRTLSDSDWKINENTDHVWKGVNLAGRHPITKKMAYKVYGPTFFLSANTTVPYGQNDGALWQGRGVNLNLISGARFEAYGLELTLKPQLSFSQNAAFKIMRQNVYDSQYGYIWGYGKNSGVDAPQRFGDKPFFTYDWGDTEVRYSYKTFTVGFGTQHIWLGPANMNPILHSNNAPSYPKFDIGIRKQPIIIPKINYWLGDIEARMWAGRLSESKYFDNDKSNDHSMILGASFAYTPFFLPGLNLFANRIILTKWEMSNLKYIGAFFFIPINGHVKVNTEEDQKYSIGFSWRFPKVGLEIYGEVGKDDYSANFFVNPFHATAYLLGLKKTIDVKPEWKLYGELTAEITLMEMTQDFQFQWPYNFYFHHLLVHGYTNRGQWLGAGIGTGGNSQYIDFTLYYPKGKTKISFLRHSVDSNFIYKNALSKGSTFDEKFMYKNFASFKVLYSLAIATQYFITNFCAIDGEIAYNIIHNPYYQPKSYPVSEKLHNGYFKIGCKFYF